MSVATLRRARPSVCVKLAVAALISLAALASPASAQEAPDTSRTREVDVRADLLEEDEVGGERVRRLTGDVHLRQGDTELWSERAIQYLERREILFTGRVLVVERGDTLRADSVLYNRATKVGRATGNVQLTDGDVLVTAPSGIYYTRDKRAQFTEGVHLVDSTAVLTSAEGEYWSDEKRAEFSGSVQLDEERTHLEADSVTYLRERDVSIARGNVFIERLGGEDEADADSLTRTLLFGQYAYNEDSTAYSRIEGSPLLVQLRQDSVGADIDTLLIRAVVLESSRSDALSRLIAIDSVRIWQRDLAATADSVVYDRIRVASDSLTTNSDSEAGPLAGPNDEGDDLNADMSAQDDAPPDSSDVRHEEVRLFRSPIAWLQDNQVSGDTMIVRLYDAGSDSLFVRGRAFVARQDSASQRVHQLRGENLAAAFDGDSLRTLTVGPRAEAIHFRSDEAENPAGAVRLSADRITFRFRDNDIERLAAIRGTEGTYYPEDLLPTPFELEGYLWVPERKPTKLGLLGPLTIPDRRPQLARSDPANDAANDPPARDELGRAH